MARSADFKSTNALMRHIRKSAGILIAGSRDKQALIRMGYFHGYKGYRYAGEVSRRIPYSSFDELRAVMEFDSQVKALLYPLLMDIEMAMKNLALVEILEAAQSSELTDIYARLMPGNKRGQHAGKLTVKHSNSSVLLAEYKRRNPIIQHYYDMPNEGMPVWALFEVLSMGAFAGFLEQLSNDVLARIAESWGMKRRDAALMPHFVFAVTGLRNCVAHNSAVFDARFAQSRSIRKEVKKAVSTEIGLLDGDRLTFETITDYFVLVLFLVVSLGLSRRRARALVKTYTRLTNDFRDRVPVRIFDMIVHTNNRSRLRAVRQWVARC